LLLRLSMGIMFLAHAGLKLFVFGLAGTVRFFDTLGLPPALAYFAIALEVIGGLTLILGIWARAAALILTLHMLAIIWFVQGSKGWVFSAPGGGWEFPAFWAVALLALALLGDGAYALAPTPRLGRGGARDGANAAGIRTRSS
jgi:putative oxidoreductase